MKYTKPIDSGRVHQEWLSLVEVSGPFLSLPVLRRTWPSLDPLDKQVRESLRLQHGTWQAGGPVMDWVLYGLRDLLGWGDALHTEGLDVLALEVPQHDTTLVPSFALIEPGAEAKPDTTRLIGLISDGQPTARVKGEDWSATPVDRVAQLCRHHGVELGLVTDGRWWALVWAPRGGVTTSAVFDAISWPEAAERDVVRAFVSLLNRARFFSFPEGETLPALLRASLDSQEDITEALGVQVRQAVELLVAAIGRADTRDRDAGGEGVGDATAHEVYRGAVTVMMRIVFLLFAEERGLLPADNELYANAYSAGGLYAELEQIALEGSENDLEQTQAAWHRLLALFNAVYAGVDHPRLKMHAHDGSMFDPDVYAWLPLSIDDRTVLHMLNAVQYVQLGTGKTRERRKLSFRALDVEQIGYVYEGLLSYDGTRATDTVVGLVGKPGLEEEVNLSHLERLLAGSGDGFAAKLADDYKASGIGTAAAVTKRLVPLGDAEQVEALRLLLAVTGGDRDLAERLLPFYGIIRTDLRDLPVVILPGGLYVTESSLRKNTGTHYTPRFLAEQVVEGALEPLVYRVGPLQTADRSEWVPKSADEILALKIADIAMGSAAFLVAAARYLAGHLVEAWSRQDDPRAVAYLAADRTADADEDPLIIDARRTIIEHCLYGADINPMAVEMAKLSLWLVSMDPSRPFTFVDDRLVAGDALLGITSLDQLEVLHMDARKGREIHEKRALQNFATGARTVAHQVAEARRELAEIPLGDDPLGALRKKRALLADAELTTAQARLFADLTVGAALAHAGRGVVGLRDGSILAADYVRRIGDGSAMAEVEARQQRREWLDTDKVRGGFERHPIHWPLVFPEVFEGNLSGGADPGDVVVRPRSDGPGFDAIIGNPPFLGGSKISGFNGSAYREYLVQANAGGAKGNADLVAYFVLRAHQMLNQTGQTGLIATNTLAQGDTREVGLDRLAASGIEIRHAVKSKPWPSRSAVLEYCAIWTSRIRPGEKSERFHDGVVVTGITPSLDPESRVTGNPGRLDASQRVAFQASKIDGIGFTLSEHAASAMIEWDPRNAEVLSPFINGQDVSSRPDSSASRWVINFQDWPMARAETYREPFDQALRLVKPERDKNNRQVRRERWWQYGERASKLYGAIARLKRVIVITLVSKVVMPVMVPTGQVFMHTLGVFATDDTAMLALLSSAPHYWWARARASSMKADLRYTASDVFETLPLPELTQEMRDLGDRLDTFRRSLMLSRQAGLTATYNLVNDPKNTDDDIEELRTIHRAIDEATLRAYNWDDLIGQLDHGHHLIGGREMRYTVGPAVQRELVDRLLELNHARYAEEVAKGLHDKKSKKSASQGGLF
ncbi:Eco57I restriction-modification methylase domain-containing protein [Nonomuraea insulae]|uniref:site-specific DNA-methyltransferase (adenine-specific) n=1 Tax=Nonomuraea insulae TaxID=1616787 RepID=A0ABW1CTL9_9ACTN